MAATQTIHLAGRIDPAALATNTGAYLLEIWTPRQRHFQFQHDDLTYYGNHVQNEHGLALQLWTILGYLPYTAESPERRYALTRVLQSIRTPPHIKFGVNRASQILASGTFELKGLQSPTYIFVPLVKFLQETLPHIRLIGAYL